MEPDEEKARRKQIYKSRFDTKRKEYLSRFHPVHHAAFGSEADKAAARYAAEEAEKDAKRKTVIGPALPVGTTTMTPRKKK